ncbi:NIPSNAP family protein [Kozakia baliensis]|uniref:Uncharacterized protein n=1 Tax=Kozakia baliensis TaxID=153496 RepID=A0A1D8URN0_9PROT|nr:NIPSNAP family protein [Kozakia baliensis]AOX16167.1 hypothetical protein A0U89_02425 [Kozakia baliensis]GBR22963.1 NIPSNAP family protein [Kozakia baliensis NRIC 0488]GEL65324.1 NIPSNAP family protein [Kozakia baliensis]
MSFVETLTLQCRAGTLPSILSQLEASTKGISGLGCWTTEFGTLNQITFLRSSADLSALLDAPLTNLPDSAVGVQQIDTTQWKLHGAELPAPGEHGGCYEWRCYDIVPDHRRELLTQFGDAVPARLEMSSLFALMTSLNGASRICHIWPYADLAERARLRKEATAAGVWPPKGIAPYLGAMQSSVLVPTSFSAYR